MRFADYLAEEWKPTLGCTEPASIAYAAASAASMAGGEVRGVRLACDPRIYKNCYAVGIPNSGHRVGIRWALAIGSLLPDPSAGLECFGQIDANVLSAAGRLIERPGALSVEVDTSREDLFIECRVQREKGEGRAVIQGEHTRLVLLEGDGRTRRPAADRPYASSSAVRARLTGMPFEDLIDLARALTPEDRGALRRGMEQNLAIAEHGLGLFPRTFVDMQAEESLTRTSRLVCAGVYARMWGADFPVMSLAGSGNKGIVASVPMALFGSDSGRTPESIDQALALACLVTSSTTHHLGTLSAVCGCSNAAGIGLAAGLVLLDGGGVDEISMAVNNMVGNVTGMICDGAKIGCALKTMTSVDAAFRSATLAMAGIGIPFSDGIVGKDGAASLVNLGRIATRGMAATDREILDIMQEKLTSSSTAT